jgi:hypothetical protein
MSPAVELLATLAVATVVPGLAVAAACRLSHRSQMRDLTRWRDQHRAARGWLVDSGAGGQDEWIRRVEVPVGRWVW